LYDAGGYQTINGINLLLNSALMGKGGCWLYVDPVGKALFLAGDSGSSWSSTGLGSSTVLANSQCSIAGNEVSLQGSGVQLAVALNLHFKSTFTGTKNVYWRAADQAGRSTDYQLKGSWTVQ
jgi:hypothetical protein